MKTNIYLYIFVMAFATWCMRVIPALLMKKPIENAFIKSFLYYVPYVTLAIMTFPAIVEATNEPLAGAAALVIGIAAAYMDSSPVVFITCNVPGKLLGKDAFQEIDITGVTLPMTKFNYIVTDISELADTIRESFAIARSGRPGPVLIDIQKNVTSAVCEFESIPVSRHFADGRLARLMGRPGYDFKAPKADERDIDILCDMLKKAERPLILAGGGVVRSRAHKELRELIQRLDAPIALTIMGGGAVEGDAINFTGMIGMHGSQASNIACDRCDLLLAIGTRFSDRVASDPSSFAKNAKIVHIDIDASEIDKNVKTDHHIIGDAKQIISMLLERLPQLSHEEWKKEVFSYPVETEYDPPEGNKLTPKEVIDAVVEVLPKDLIMTTDVGQHQMWALQHFHFRYPGQLVTSGGYGAMGFGLGAAIGAKLGNPDKLVLHITGDGSFRMNCHELSTEEYYGLPIITIVFNNKSLGMVRQLQYVYCDGRNSETTLDRGPDFVALAKAYGLNGVRVGNKDELKKALLEAREATKGTVIDCAIDIDEMVRPMVAGGDPITDFVIE